MSRTSRRISRPLIGVLAVLIVLGVFFTVHKLKQARAVAAVPKGAPVAPIAAPAQPADASVQTKTSPATQPAAITPAPQPNSIESSESSALVTQTPSGSGSQPHPADSPMPHQEEESTDSAGHDATPSHDAADSHDSTASRDATSSPAPQPQRTEIADSSTPSSTNSIPRASSAQPLEDARTRAQADDLVGARQILNEARIDGHLSADDTDAARKQIEQWNQTLIFSPRRFVDDPWAGGYQVASGQRLSTIAARYLLTWEALSRINNNLKPQRMRAGQTIKVLKGPFHAVVNKHAFRMDLYLGAPGGEGSMFIRSFPVGLGKDDSTPTGLWICKSGDKVRDPVYYPPGSHGGDVIPAKDPKNPLGGYWIALQGLEGQALGQESYGIHGTNEPDSIGKMASLGCIRLRPDDISLLFDLLLDGKSKVLVKE